MSPVPDGAVCVIPPAVVDKYKVDPTVNDHDVFLKKPLINIPLLNAAPFVTIPNKPLDVAAASASVNVQSEDPLK